MANKEEENVENKKGIKRKKIMDREQIEKAAERYSGCFFEALGDDRYVMAKRKAFADGARWRIHSVWHDVSEMPELRKPYIYEMDFGEDNVDYDIDVLNIKVADWESFAEIMKMTRWAYIEDLLPNKEV